MNEAEDDRLDRVVLAWLLVPRQRPSRTALAKALVSLAGGTLEAARSAAKASLGRLGARGLVAPGTSLSLGEEGRRAALAIVGLDGLPRDADFRLVKKLLVLRALGLPVTAATLKNAGRADWLIARVLTRHHHLRPSGEPTLLAVGQALAWRALGVDAGGPFDLQRACAPILLGGAAMAGAPAGEAGTVERDRANRRPDARAFARRALGAARASRTGRWHGNKVFISHVWEQLRRQGDADGETFADFQEQLVEASRAGLLRLCRADLVQAMPPGDVKASETLHLGAVFHLVEIEDR